MVYIQDEFNDGITQNIQTLELIDRRYENNKIVFNYFIPVMTRYKKTSSTILQRYDVILKIGKFGDKYLVFEQEIQKT